MIETYIYNDAFDNCLFIFVLLLSHAAFAYIYQEALLSSFFFSHIVLLHFLSTPLCFYTATAYLSIMSSSSTFKCKYCTLTFPSANSRNYHQHTQCDANPKVQAKKLETLQASKYIFLIRCYFAHYSIRIRYNCDFSSSSKR